MILVTGASGQLARRIITHLHAAGADVTEGSRSPASGGRTLDFDSPAALDLTGVETLVLVSAGYAEDDVVLARHSAVLEAARRDGVGHVLYTSLVGAGDHLGFALAHRATERALRRSGLDWTIMRNGLYAELVGALLLWDEGGLQSPFGDGHVAAPTRDDLALAAARVAAAPGRHAGSVYELTGPPFTVGDIARELDAPVQDLPLGEYRRRLLASPALLPFEPPMLASIATSVRHGFLADHGSDLTGLLGRDPHPGVEAAAAAAWLQSPQPA
ncbi:MAG TPA: NAD(P)H-binding protein [Intrasporangium sp.]|uniref:NAD(P)H-binding protein n=1 Tax=Intrasporangium sp. TaxID=1925024 RepID=UPI002D790187|nr:NAD(P)H-binding protein [Intrasporangium sp.]HET7397543.1 NAD(P)H-binding protein [Intrasporangium sp.]